MKWTGALAAVAALMFPAAGNAEAVGDAYWPARPDSARILGPDDAASRNGGSPYFGPYMGLGGAYVPEGYVPLNSAAPRKARRVR